MKIKPLKRSSATSIRRECIGDLRQHGRNLNPVYHPMQRAREYSRAVTSAKLERMFAKPLISGNLENGHRDAVTATATSTRSLLPLVSGGADGSVKIWDLASRKAISNLETAHSRTVTGLTFAVSGQEFYSCSDDGFVHRWLVHPTMRQVEIGSLDVHSNLRAASKRTVSRDNAVDSSSDMAAHGPVNSWRTAGSFKSIDHHWIESDQFATASDQAVQVWSCHRSSPISTFGDLWGSSDTVTSVRYNPAERNLLASCSADRGIGIHDTRMAVSLRKTVLRMNCNDLRWNPMEPMTFVVANEDYNAYTFDMRNLEQPTRIYKGHIAAVMSVAWSPTGREFVTGSYDRTIRIFDVTQGGHSRDVYHTKRMQRVLTVQFTADHKFIISGSDDSNIRLWKAHSSEQLGQTTLREEAAQTYRQALIQRYQHLPEVHAIHKSRKIPVTIRKQTQQALIQKQSAERKHANRVKFDKIGAHKFTSEKEKAIVKQVE